MSTKLILLIEDDASDIENTKQALASLNTGYTLQTARNGADGLGMLTSEGRETLPDLILLNLNMPKMNGFEFLRIIKSYHNLKHIPVYIISGSSEEYNRQLALNSGASGYILKPLSFSGGGAEQESVKKLKAELGGTRSQD